MNEPIDTSLDNCGCCEPEPTPSPLHNRPGLPALAYRSGIYAAFFQRMLGRLGRSILPDGDYGGTRPLTGLTTRSPDDPAVALLDASAVVADVLTFYQERIANEGYLRTATERRSILEMARAIGYELNPGVAASVYLAFTIEDAAGAPESSEIAKGTKVQSVPPQGQLPQTFETSETISARPEWNAILPRLSKPQKVTTTVNQIYLDGTATKLKVGDPLLLIEGASRNLVRVASVTVDTDLKRTIVEVDGTTAPMFVDVAASQGELKIEEKIPFSEQAVEENILGKQWTDSEMNAFLTFNTWDSKKLVDTLAERRKRNPDSTGEVHALRTTVGFFGNNAPAHKSLPSGTGITSDFGQNWDQTGGWEIWKDQQAVDTTTYYSDTAGADVFLERALQGLTRDSWVALGIVDATPKYYKINKIVEKSLGAFAMSGKVTGLKLNKPDQTAIGQSDKDSTFIVRDTVAHLQSEKLALVELPITDDLIGNPNTLQLDGLVLGLNIGQALILVGERTEASGVTESEVLIIQEINHVNGFTELTLENGLTYEYKRDTVTINANVARATHGETVSEILGNGNGAQANQKFTLKKPPLTYTAAATPSGGTSTLQLRVNNLLWSEASSLYPLGPKDQSYTIRLDDDGKPTIVFGDGEKGARLPTGVNNVVATYRSGVGLAGQVEAGSLTILQSRPLGVKSVVNPLAASGAGDPEVMGNARSNAPLTVRTLDRIVSREDYEDFASAFAGIGKAQAIDLWSGEHHLVHLTVAGEDGRPVTDPDFLENFMDALDEARDPTQLIKVDTFSQLLFNLKVNLAVDSRYAVEDVFAAVETALTDAFSFPKRGFGQGVTTAEVVTIVQKIDGVVFVDIDSLYPSDENEDLKQILTVDIAHVENDEIQLAQLLLINTFGITLQEVKA